MLAALAVDQSPSRNFTGPSHPETLHNLPGRHIVALCKRNDRVRSKHVKGETKPRAADLRRKPPAAKRLKHGPAQLQSVLRPGRPAENGNLGARGTRCHPRQTAPTRQRSGSPVVGDPFGHAVHGPAPSAVPRERLGPSGRPLSGVPLSDPGILMYGLDLGHMLRANRRQPKPPGQDFSAHNEILPTPASNIRPSAHLPITPRRLQPINPSQPNARSSRGGGRRRPGHWRQRPHHHHAQRARPDQDSSWGVRVDGAPFAPR
jgi:hypothetical protein